MSTEQRIKKQKNRITVSETEHSKSHQKRSLTGGAHLNNGQINYFLQCWKATRQGKYPLMIKNEVRRPNQERPED